MEPYSAIHIGLVGERLRIRGPDRTVLSSPATADAGFVVGGRVQFLCSARPGGAYSRVAAKSPGSTRATYEGKPVFHRKVVAVDADNVIEHFGYLAWEGASGSLFADRVSLDPDRVGLNAMLEMLSVFAIHEHAHGLSLKAKRGSQVSLVASQPPTVIKELVGVGILSVTGEEFSEDAGAELAGNGGWATARSIVTLSTMTVRTIRASPITSS